MPKRNDDRSAMTPADLAAAYHLNCTDEIMDACLTAGALVALADRRVDPVECDRLVAFLQRHELLTVSKIEAKQAFERRICELREPGYVLAAAYRLGRNRGLSPARILIAAAEEVAAADSRLDPSELEILDLLRIMLRARPPRPAPALYRSEESA
jgi:tellurite resistance protein TerB